MLKNISCFNSEIIIINYILSKFKYSKEIMNLLNKDDFFFEITKKSFLEKKIFLNFNIFNEKNIFSIFKNIIEKSKKRKILKILFNISFDLLYNENIDKKIFLKVKKILNFNNKKIIYKLDYFKLLKNFLFSKNELLFSGYNKLDYLINGFQQGDLIILAGRPSIGKTSFAINIVKNLIFLKKNIIIFSLEMSTLQIFIKLLSIMTEINQNNFKLNNFSEYDLKKISFIIKNINFNNLIINDCSSLSSNDIENYLNVFSKEKKIDLILIDYIQLMKSNLNINNRVLELSEISRSLKLIAKNFSCVIIALSQLNRLVEYRVDKFPVLSDLKDSGSLEQDADIVIFLYKNNFKNINILISKNRNGPLGQIEFLFKNEYTKFNQI
ncbi:putative replicative DNA helicase [Candidatus Carsonella ruddii CS isolate Thao2000]|uniref:Putative replicative DNA helicase n=1 Tax=Candidatus Carsonella ruddii CS isolate Thao2000 TaxID=1202537 RepID=J7GSJ5_CARRU|nr:DnaB-like helicase C-terminal domain-containing protein [Candidatus Carsonella ruddii]AFP83727.1 putative replicative DNA helicase [Candidatus Carsonella ruddii CS isolate Thao2000]